MDAFGSLELAWCQGYSGTKACYVSRDVVCFKCGNNIKFVGEDGQESVYPSPGEGLGPLAVHGINKLFAFADVGVEPTIYVIQYPSFRVVAELKGGAKLEYSELVFSSSEYLASISGVPEYQLTIWRYTTGELLCSHDLSHLSPTGLSFNPANWRQLCVTTETELSLWSLEQSHNTFMIKKHKLKLPAMGANPGAEEGGRDNDIPTRASTRMSKASIDLPRSSMAGVKGQEAERFQEYEDEKERVTPVSHIWTPSGDILVGCAGGQLLKVDGEMFSIKMMYNPGPRPLSAFSRADSALSERPQSEAQSMASQTQIGPQDGAMNCLALHKRGLYAAGHDGILRRLEVMNEGVKVVESVPLGAPVTSLGFNPTHHHLAIGSSRGCVHFFDPSEPGNVKQLFDIHYGNFVAVDVISPGNEHVVTLREDGEVQMWSMDSAKLVSSLSIGFQTFSLAASPLSHLVCVGSASGHLFVIDLCNMEDPRIVHRVHLHSGPVKHTVCTQDGRFILTASDDGQIFVLDGRPSTKFEVLGYIEVVGDVQALSAYVNDKEGSTKVLVTTNSPQKGEVAASKLSHFNLPHDLAQDLRSKHESLKCNFKQEVVNRLNFNFYTPSFGAAVTEGNIAFFLSQNTKQLHKVQLPSQPPKKETSKDSYLRPLAEFPGHQLSGGKLLLSPHNRWLTSVGRDGKMAIRAVGALDRVVVTNAHDFRAGGVQDVVYSGDAQRMFTTGLDGTLACYKWKPYGPDGEELEEAEEPRTSLFTTSGQAKAKSAVESARNRHTAMIKEQQAQDEALTALPEWTMSASLANSRPPSATEKADKEQSEKEEAIEKAIEMDEIYTTPTPTPGTDATWLETMELEALKEEDKQYVEVKQQLRMDIRGMRRQLQSMMTDNEKVADIEQLAQHEFDLDIEEQNRLQAEGESEVSRIREEKEFENLAKMYLAELIKRECWDQMEVKGRGIMAFNTSLEVANYPMKPRSKEEQAELEKVRVQRRIELADVASRREIAEIHNKAATTPEDDLNETDDVENEGNEKPSTTGSLGAEYGGDSDLFYSQFELHTREQKLNQVVLLEDAIHRIKVAFNKEFTEVYKKKDSEISKIREKNKRIRKILGDLDMPVDVYEPEMGVIEKPEMLLTVSDQEVKIERFMLPEQRRKLEEEKAAEAERMLKEKGDNWRERGLELMMGGVLEIKKEDELKKDVPLPAFMQAGKSEAEWTEEEKKAAQDYERKVKELNEEREKYRKQLEMELKKLQTLSQEGTLVFDEALYQLFLRKVKTEMVIYQEELKILRIRYTLLLEEELNNREAELNDLLEFKKEMKQLATEALVESKKNVDAFRNDYEILTAEDKVMDKAFKREFGDVAAVHVDQLYKLFRRRARGQKVRGADTPIYDPTSGNPFSERPSTARQNEAAKSVLEHAMADLDKDTNCPEGVEASVWERMCVYRRQKVESENLVKTKALVLADMQAFLQKRMEEDEQLRTDIDDLTDSISRLKDDRLRFTCNLEVQLLLKQGQVEVDPGPFIPDYKCSLLLHRNVTEDLNAKIRQLGESKISSMVESKDFRKGIIQLEWEHKKMTMEMEDLQNKMRDIQNLKVTREIQAYLNEDDYDSKKAQEISTLEQTIVLQKHHHEKNVMEKKRILKELKKTVGDRDEENSALSGELEELNVSVNERRHIHEVNADKRSDAGRDERYHEIVQRRKLVDLAKAQAQEVAVLRAEVERLRMRTFPALVQVEH